MEISDSSPSPVILSRSFAGRYENLAAIGAFIREAAQQAELSDFSVYQVETAVDEACSNIIEHAYGAENRGEIRCTCSITPEGLTILLNDNGQPFDLNKKKTPNLSNELKDRSNHGVGLHFIRQWMDRVEYTSSSQGNQLTLFKRKEA